MMQALRLSLGTASALGFARFAYGLLLPAMRDDLHWSLAEAGAMNTANGSAICWARRCRRWSCAGRAPRPPSAPAWSSRR